MDRRHLQERLTEIEAALPLWLAGAEDERDFWSVFADEANHLASTAEVQDKDFVREGLDAMLRKMGLIGAPRAAPGQVGLAA